MLNMFLNYIAMTVFVMTTLFGNTLSAATDVSEKRGLRVGDIFDPDNVGYTLSNNKIRIGDSIVPGKINLLQFCWYDCIFCQQASIVLTGNHELVDDPRTVEQYLLDNGASQADVDKVVAPFIKSTILNDPIFGYRGVLGFIAGGPVFGPPYPLYDSLADELDLHYIEMLAFTSFYNQDISGSDVSSIEDAIVYSAQFSTGVDELLHDNEDPDALENGIIALFRESFGAGPSFIIVDKNGRILAMPTGQNPSFWPTGDRGDVGTLYDILRYATEQPVAPIDPIPWINSLIGFVEFNSIVVDEDGNYVSGVFDKDATKRMLTSLNNALKQVEKGKLEAAAGQLEAYLHKFQGTLDKEINKKLLGDVILSSRGNVTARVWVNTSRLIGQLRNP